MVAPLFIAGRSVMLQKVLSLLEEVSDSEDQADENPCSHEGGWAT